MFGSKPNKIAMLLCNINKLKTDLFCLQREQPINYGSLDTSLRNSCTKSGLKDVEGFINKCIQLFETTVVRHGLMLVGPTGSGKTKVRIY